MYEVIKTHYFVISATAFLILSILSAAEAVFTRFQSISESGIKDGNDTRLAYDSGADAVLVGETLMRADDKKKMLKSLKEMRV